MDNKIGIQELAAAIAKVREIDGSEAEIFCRSVFEVVSEFLVKDKLVKIKGLGTFKLIEVSDRESINVNTGERIVIAGHTKMSFTPDSVLRDTVNRPFADFETTVLSDNASTEKMEFIPAEPAKAEKPKVEELKKELEDALEAVEMQTEEVMQPKGLEEYFDYYCYPSSVTDYNEQGKYLEKNAQKRQYLYDAIGRLVRVYAELAADIDKVYNPAEVNQVFTRVHDYEETRRALMLRSGDSVDFKVYDAEMRSLIDRYVMAGEIDEIDDMDEFSFLDYISHAIEETEPEEPKKKGSRSNAETMINNTRRYVNRRRNSNPNEYMRLSARLERLIKEA